MTNAREREGQRGEHQNLTLAEAQQVVDSDEFRSWLGEDAAGTESRP